MGVGEVVGVGLGVGVGVGVGLGVVVGVGVGVGAGVGVGVSLIMYVANLDSYFVGFFITLRSYVCRILGMHQVLMYVCRLYLFLMSAVFPILNSYVSRIRHIVPK